MDLAKLRIAIVHDWLVVPGGAEKVLAQLIELFPQADLFTTVYDMDPRHNGFLKGKVPTTTFIQRMPFGKRGYRRYLPLMPLAIEQLDMAGYDLVLSSSYCVAKGVITGPYQKHLSYVHSSARYAWDLQAVYLREARMDRGLLGALTRLVLHYFRLWDVRTVHGVDRFLANSRFIAERVRKTYGREAQVVYPPVDTEHFTPGEAPREDFYLTASRLVPYKMIPMIAEAFTRMPERRLVIIGSGPDITEIRRRAGPNVQVLGYQSEAVLIDHMRRARAFVFAAEEDFGIVPLEAQACGCPVIAYGRGGARETVIDAESGAEGATGLFFRQQTADAVIDAVNRFEANLARFTPEACRANALRFSPERFRAAIRAEVESLFDGND